MKPNGLALLLRLLRRSIVHDSVRPHRGHRPSVWGGRPSHPPERGLPKAQLHSFLEFPPPHNPTKPKRAASSVVPCESCYSNTSHAKGGVSGLPAVWLVHTPPQGLQLPSLLAAHNERGPTRSRLPFGPRSQASLQKAQGPGLAKRSLTAFLRPPKVPRHAGLPRGEHRGSRHRFL